MKHLLVAGSLFVLASLAAFVQADEPAEKPDAKKKWPSEFECRWTDDEITLDGKADEAAWKNAQTIDSFYLPWLGENARAAKTGTRARLLWDREYLYFFAEMDDADLYADITEHDGEIWNNDVFELFFKPGEKEHGYYEFQVNPAGAVLDMFLPRRNAGGYPRFKGDGEFHLENKVVLRGTLNEWQDRDEGWSVEGRMPWRDFMRTGGRPDVGETWGFALCRYDFSVDFEGPDLSTNAPMSSKPFPDFHYFEDYARLKFVRPQGKQAANLPKGLEPYVTTSRVVGAPEPPPPYRVARALPKLALEWPIYAIREPGSQRYWVVEQAYPYGASRLGRTKGDPREDGTIEELMPIPAGGVAYDIDFHPAFEKNGYVYIGANGKFDGETMETRITRYTVDRKPPYRFDPESAQVVLAWASDGHNGGAMTFGLDGMLYVTSGDGTSDSDMNVVGQDLKPLTSKVLRIDVDHPADGKPYSVPKDNPFLDVKDAAPETWAYGLRNPWRITIDQETGHLWVGNNGQDLWEQTYLIERGANYGWSVVEGSYPFYPERPTGPTPISKPTTEHHHSDARSLTGGVVYYGTKLPDLRGAYIYGDYSTGKIWGVKHNGEKVEWLKELADTTLQITAFAVDADGELLIVDHQGAGRGALYDFEPNPDTGASSDFPRKLSQTGLFKSVAGHEVAPGMIPYSVNAPLWSDGAYKERFIALPPTMLEGDNEVAAKIDFTTQRGWNFPEKTVLVKSFALEMTEGDPSSRRWIETRLFTKQQNEWVGYSYRWNKDGTDAELVSKEGLDEPFAIRTADGERSQTWHYPSRTECMVCHSRAANFVLGPSLVQMAKSHDYGDRTEPQLAVLERLGVLRVNTTGEAHEAVRQELRSRGLTAEEVEKQLGKELPAREQRTIAVSSLLYHRPETYEGLADPSDEGQPLDLRARAYLHANCAQCHVSAGGGNAQMELSIYTSLADMKLLDAKPLHHTFGLDDARLVAPGHAERSVLLKRIGHRGAGQMPPLATSQIDHGAVRLFEAWIESLPSDAEKSASKP